VETKDIIKLVVGVLLLATILILGIHAIGAIGPPELVITWITVLIAGFLIGNALR
jgi:hypothetical protein